MKGLHWGWYVLIGVAALAPVGVRVLTWPGFRRQAVDPAMAQAGQTLFLHEWKPGDPLSPGGDGLGPVYNATSCVACHHQGGAGGAGGLEHNVTTFTITEMSREQNRQTRQGVVHSFALGEPEMLRQVHRELPALSRPSLAMLVSLPADRRPVFKEGNNRSRFSFPAGVHLSQRNTPALFGADLIDAVPDRLIIANERKQRLKWGLASSKSEDLPVGRRCVWRTDASDTSAGRPRVPVCPRSCRPPAPTNSVWATPDRPNPSPSVNPTTSLWVST